ncbi:MAG: HAD-IC family P-type ATPase [Nitrospira sp.]|nr:HAD-IC family P-type ATPase [Nitrospira sp.]
MPPSICETPLATTWYRLDTIDLAAKVGVDLESGLSSEEVNRRRAQEGYNELPEAPPRSWACVFVSQFSSVIVWVLIGAAMLSGLLADWLDTAAILAIVLFNGLLGFVQEFRAERSLAALRKMSVATARVLREGTLQLIPARELVPGDVILLEAGDRIPADARLLYTVNFQTQEAALTGESTPVQKDTQVNMRAGWSAH